MEINWLMVNEKNPPAKHFFFLPAKCILLFKNTAVKQHKIIIEVLVHGDLLYNNIVEFANNFYRILKICLWRN